MAKLNKSIKQNPVYTEEGSMDSKINPELQLRRSVMACMLWEDNFYEDGESIVERIKSLVPKVKPYSVYDMAVEAREKMKLRHVPLLLVREMARYDSHKYLVKDSLERVIQRADELSEFLAIYWEDGRCPLSSQIKKGLSKAFNKFNEYQLAKYNQDKKVKLKDVLFLCHAKPKDKEQEKLWKRLINNELKIPDTWEVSLSSGSDKKKTWERLLKEKNIGALALLRNLRNMEYVGVDESLIKKSINNMKVEKVLPFRFISAAKYAPNLEQEIEKTMFRCVENAEKLKGKTIILVDVSGSMDSVISSKSEVIRIDVACGLAILLKEICQDLKVYTFSDGIVQVPARRGFALRDCIKNSQIHGSTEIRRAVNAVNNEGYDRLIIITDEQSQDIIPNPNGKGYVVNISTNKNGIGYYKWIHIDGWSEYIINYIQEYEKLLE